MNKKLDLVPRKLTLQREALRRLDLDDTQLKAVAGGNTTDCIAMSISCSKTPDRSAGAPGTNP
ncbi:MAG: hypothetical protein K8W52_06350 [Deltaproteobacteria bacterium]|nr:hypothetical protein [Deltaproteobacteria bacterium]